MIKAYKAGGPEGIGRGEVSSALAAQFDGLFAGTSGSAEVRADVQHVHEAHAPYHPDGAELRGILRPEEVGYLVANPELMATFVRSMGKWIDLANVQKARDGFFLALAGYPKPDDVPEHYHERSGWSDANYRLKELGWD